MQKQTAKPFKMRTNRNLELQLFPSTDSDFDSGHAHRQSTEDSSRSSGHYQQPQLKVSDDAEVQARAILSLASREIEEGMKFPSRWETASSSTVPYQLSLKGNLSTKMSLRRFLQKRKSRIQSYVSLYTFNH
ncbi:JAZ8 [Tripterygium wilfordii]|uniref:JAZ8 n=1 Tax=Tripterygium wilfordii TaxID=458696 RepID=A0A7J7CQA2_TRIWF|nr:protein TIFY 5B-like [Tripterygium wilfordii]KAF5736267.1 JAZ8 [Tripterygium wilfordii]